MKKKALRKDFYMEIRRSTGRFMSIFFIVAIGGALFSGIRASAPDMRYSGAAYFDNKNMMDIQVNLKLWVKVRKEWRDSELYMKNYGYDGRNV